MTFFDYLCKQFVNAIFTHISLLRFKYQGDDQYVIDAAACLDCGSCSDTCPNSAIVPEE